MEGCAGSRTVSNLLGNLVRRKVSYRLGRGPAINRPIDFFLVYGRDKRFGFCFEGTMGKESLRLMIEDLNFGINEYTSCVSRYWRYTASEIMP